jgi:hypothetical protein
MRPNVKYTVLISTAAQTDPPKKRLPESSKMS